MDNVEVKPEVAAPVAAKPLFRANTCNSWITEAVLALNGDFNHKDAVNAAKDYATKNDVGLGNIDRNCRYVVVRLLKAGILTKVRRGRWIKV